jgi:hypothetical protein
MSGTGPCNRSQVSGKYKTTHDGTTPPLHYSTKTSKQTEDPQIVIDELPCIHYCVYLTVSTNDISVPYASLCKS